MTTQGRTAPTAIVGRRVGRLTVVGSSEPYIRPGHKPLVKWLCQCDCGNQVTRFSSQLGPKQRFEASCGCARGEKRRVHGMAGKARPPEYEVWRAMRRRTTNQNCPDYQYYGERGIGVCARWDSFPAFFEDMGPRPSAAHSIDRIDNELGYSPDNCRWATAVEQRHNQRRYIADHGAAA